MIMHQIDQYESCHKSKQDPVEMSLDHYCSNNHKQLTINCPYVLYYTQQYKHVSYTFTSCDFFVDHVILTIERS